MHCRKYNIEANYNHNTQCYLLYETMSLSFSQVFYYMVCMYQVKIIWKFHTVVLPSKQRFSMSLFLFPLWWIWILTKQWEKRKKRNGESYHAKSERSHIKNFFFKWRQQQKERKRTANVSVLQIPKILESSPFNAHKSHQMHDSVCEANSHISCLN